MLQTTFLYYLVQISHYQSLSIAAEKLHVSQPALSAGIKKLEDQLGVKLLHRTYKGVSLTEEGNNIVMLAEKAFAYLDEIETMYQPAKSTNRNLFDGLTLYCNPAYSPMVMSALLASNKSGSDLIRLHDLTPDINVNQLLREDTNNIVLGIVSDIHKLPNDIIATKLCTSQAYIMCTHDFPYIDSTKSSISFKELVHVPLSIIDNSLEFQKILLKGIRQYGEPEIKVLSPNTNTVTLAVHNGIAASFSNKFFRSSLNTALRYLPIRNAPKFYLSLTSHRNTDPNKIYSLAELLKQQLL